MGRIYTPVLGLVLGCVLSRGLGHGTARGLVPPAIRGIVRYNTV